MTNTPNTIDRTDLRLFLGEERKNVAALQAVDKIIDSPDFPELKVQLCHAWACIMNSWRETTARIVKRGGLLHIGADWGV